MPTSQGCCEDWVRSIEVFCFGYKAQIRSIGWGKVQLTRTNLILFRQYKLECDVMCTYCEELKNVWVELLFASPLEKTVFFAFQHYLKKPYDKIQPEL